MQTYFEYEVKMLEDDEEEIYYGVTTGENYQDAINNVIEYFGKYSLISVKLEEWDAEGCLVMTKEALSELREEVEGLQ